MRKIWIFDILVPKFYIFGKKIAQKMMMR